MALSHSVAGVLRGAGKASVPMTIMLICWCIIRVIYITVTVRLIPDIRVVFFAYPLTWTLSTIAFLVYYFKADWIHHFDRLDRKAS
jgi:Na+-driven multidrug efflux pump